MSRGVTSDLQFRWKTTEVGHGQKQESKEPTHCLSLGRRQLWKPATPSASPLHRVEICKHPDSTFASQTNQNLQHPGPANNTFKMPPNDFSAAKKLEVMKLTPGSLELHERQRSHLQETN